MSRPGDVMVDEYLHANRERWDALVPIHARSELYNLERFKAGELTLHSIEREELGDVTGKSLLHLQCHFGMDTLSWARLGARVTGVDFSAPAIELARSLSEELDIPAEFICSGVYELPQVLDDQFDIVFTSYGVLCWLPDLQRWAEVISHFLKPGGFFHIVEMHPFGVVFDDENPTELRVAYPYFDSGAPMRFDSQGSYADRDAQVEHSTAYEWFHSLGGIVNALVSAGLRLEFLHEYPYCSYKMLPFMEQGDDGWWRLRENVDSVPLTFSLKASKGAG